MPKRRPLRRLRRRLSRKMLTRAFVSVWTLTTVAMIALALILSHISDGGGAGDGCGPSWPSTSACTAAVHAVSPPAD